MLAGLGVVRAVEPAAAASPAAQAPAAPAAAHEAVAQAPANPAAAAAIPGQAATERQNADLPPDIVAELDEDEQLKDAAVVPGVQQTYLKAVFDRLKEELGGGGRWRCPSARAASPVRRWRRTAGATITSVAASSPWTPTTSPSRGGTSAEPALMRQQL